MSSFRVSIIGGFVVGLHNYVVGLRISGELQEKGTAHAGEALHYKVREGLHL